jgi:predicted glycosyltransferase
MRFLFYSHDSYGLGHIRRTLSIAQRLLKDFSQASALVLTGAPRAHYLRYPSRCDYVKLPSVTKSFNGQYVSREIAMTLEQTVALRSRLIGEAAESFRPDVFLVDHTPLGLCGEIRGVIEEPLICASGSLRVLGMRDILDEPAAVRRTWQREGIFRCLRNCYDLILVYGQRELFDPIAAYEIPDDVAAKMVFTGYIARTGTTVPPQQLRQQFAPRTGRLVVVTVGGGGDGNRPLRSFLEGYRALGPAPPFEALLITGPLMSPRKRARLFDQTEGLAGATVLEFHPDVPALYRAADFVIAMAGYNTICELACAGAGALLVPRTSPRKEQLLRARLLSEAGLARYLTAQEATPAALMRETLAGLVRHRAPRRWGLNFAGLDNISDAVGKLVGVSAGSRALVQEVA